MQESCPGTSGVAEFPQGVQGALEASRGSIAELSRDGWGANTIGGQLPKELADKRATADLGDKGRPLNSERVDKDLKREQRDWMMILGEGQE